MIAAKTVTSVFNLISGFFLDSYHKRISSLTSSSTAFILFLADVKLRNLLTASACCSCSAMILEDGVRGSLFTSYGVNMLLTVSPSLVSLRGVVCGARGDAPGDTSGVVSGRTKVYRGDNSVTDSISLNSMGKKCKSFQ